MKKQVVYLVFVLSIALNLGALGAAAYHRFGEARGASSDAAASREVGPSLREELKLTDEQAQAFADLYTTLQARVGPVRERIHGRRRELFEILAAPSPDREAVDRVLSEINRGQLEIQRAVADYLLAEMRLLSPAQRTTLVESLLRTSGGTAPPKHLPLLGPGGARRPDEPR